MPVRRSRTRRGAPLLLACSRRRRRRRTRSRCSWVQCQLTASLVVHGLWHVVLRCLYNIIAFCPIACCTVCIHVIAVLVLRTSSLMQEDSVMKSFFLSFVSRLRAHPCAFGTLNFAPRARAQTRAHASRSAWVAGLSEHDSRSFAVEPVARFAITRVKREGSDAGDQILVF